MTRGDNTAPIPWVSKCGGARHKRAGLPTRTLGRLDTKGGWSHTVKHVPGVQNVLADSISRWPRHKVGRKVGELTNRRLVGAAHR